MKKRLDVKKDSPIKKLMLVLQDKGINVQLCKRPNISLVGIDK